MVKIISWNVNGLRACLKKGFLEWLEFDQPDILGLQEVRTLQEQLPKSFDADIKKLNYQWFLSPAEKKGYSGVAYLVKNNISVDNYSQTLGEEKFDSEGRYQVFDFTHNNKKYSIANGYFPNGSGPNRDHSRVPYKLEFYEAVRQALEAKKTDVQLCMGDYNTAFSELDLARPKTNHKTSGFLPIEREGFGLWLQNGWRDFFREQHVDEEGHYSWWSQRGNCRDRNVGWRIDYILGLGFKESVSLKSGILKNVLGSDHCPIKIEI